MEKHRCNILPDMDDSEFDELVLSIRTHGYDKDQPVVTYQDAALDGWQRYRASQVAGVQPHFKPFRGTDLEAIEFVLKVNTRRNLTSQQRAVMAVEADEIMTAIKAAVEAERRRTQAETLRETLAERNQEAVADVAAVEPEEKVHFEVDEYSQVEAEFKESSSQKIDSNSEAAEEGLAYEPDPEFQRRPNQRKAAHTIAKKFNTNRTYVAEALKLKETAPEKLAEVKAGTTTFQEIKKEAEKAVIDEDPTRDKFTEMAAELSKALHGHLTAIKNLIEQGKLDFYGNKQDFLHWCPQLSSFNIDIPMIDVKALKSIRICKYCEGAKCGICHETGYLTGAHYIAKE